MKIIYCHHAERQVQKNKPRSQDDEITENGIKDAELTAELLAQEEGVVAIYTSNFYRCKQTAHIINRNLNAPIYEEPRLNEVGSVEGESWKDCLNRNIGFLSDLEYKYNDDATIICVTSGVNLSAFVCWNLGIKPKDDFPSIGATNCTPVIFHTQSKIKFREVTLKRELFAHSKRKDKNYIIKAPTPGEMKTHLKYKLRSKGEQMQMFTNKLKREYYLSKKGLSERAADMGELAIKKFLGSKIAIDIMQLIKDICQIEEVDFFAIRTTTALKLNEEQCIQNMITYTERLFYLDTKINETLMLIYSTLVSYINYNEIIYEDIEHSCLIVEEEEGSYLNGRLMYKL